MSRAIDHLVAQCKTCRGAGRHVISGTAAAKYIRRERDRAGMTRGELAARVGISASYLRKLESNLAKHPIGLLTRIAEAVRVATTKEGPDAS